MPGTEGDSATVASASKSTTSNVPTQVKMQSNSVLFHDFNPEVEDINSYLDRFECFTIVNNIATENKAKYFIACVGPLVYQRLLLLAIPKRPTELTFPEMEELLRAEYKRKPLVHVARHNFRQRKQRMGEAFREFFNALKELSQDCVFENAQTLKEELKSQIISGIRDPKTQGYFFMQQKLTLDDVVKKAEIDEQAGDGVQHFRNGQREHEMGPSSDVHRISESYSTKRSNRIGDRNNRGSARSNRQNAITTAPANDKIVCFRCARKGHKADVCFYKEATCNRCKKVGHIAVACSQSRENLMKEQTPSRIYQIDDQNSEAEESSLSFPIWDQNLDDYAVEEINAIRSREPGEKVFTELLIDGRAVVMEADSGSRYTIMSRANFVKLNLCHPILPCKIILQSYTGNFVFVLGYVLVTVTYRKVSYPNLKLLIVDEKYDSIFGREWWFKIKFDIFETQNSKICKLDTPFDLKYALNNVIVEFNEIFNEPNGLLKNVVEHVSIDYSVKPIFCRHRTVVYSLRKNVESEIERLMSLGIYVPVTSAKWATPLVVVQKSGGAVRLVGDYSVTINRAIIPEEYPIPNIEEILADFGKCKFYSKFDVREAYMHVPVDEETAQLLTVNTTRGLFKVTRLNYGIQSAPAKWQRYVETIFKPVEGCRCFYDDIKVSSNVAIEHLKKIKQFLKICRENGIRLRRSKCQILTNELNYLGFRVNEKGIHKTAEKVEAILKAPPPRNTTEIKSFTGLVGFYSRFLPNLSSVLHPINRLLRKEVKFAWDAACQEAFNKVKREIASSRVLCHFEPGRKVILATDASPYAIGAVLSHEFPKGERPIAFASRTLSRTESNYSQIDKESLAIYWGFKRFFYYLFGRKFILYIDCKPLKSIFDKNAAKPTLSATRLLHYAMYLQGFDYEIRCKRSEDHANADFLSRFLVEKADESWIDEPSVVNLNRINSLPMSLQELSKASQEDEEIKKIFDTLKSGNQKELEIVTKFTLENGCVLYGTRIFVPKIFREAILRELHVGHLGISKMKGLARSYVYWPRIDRDIEERVRTCIPCQQNANAVSVPSHPWEIPEHPWERVHIDYAGPFLQYYFLLVVDAFSKWPEIFEIPATKLHGTSSAATIEKLFECFARFGFPNTLVSDNGVQFVSQEFREFCQTNCIKKMNSAVYHPQSNGQAERFVQTLKRALRIAVMEKPEIPIRRKLQTFLLAYRRAPLANGKSPCQLMLGRAIRSRLDGWKGVEQVAPGSDRFQTVNVPVWFRVFQGPRNWERGMLTRNIGAVMVEVRDANGQMHRRHLSQVRRAYGTGDCGDEYPASPDWRNEATPVGAIPAVRTAAPPDGPAPGNSHTPPTAPPTPSAQEFSIDTAPPEPPRIEPSPRRSCRTRKEPDRFSP